MELCVFAQQYIQDHAPDTVWETAKEGHPLSCWMPKATGMPVIGTRHCDVPFLVKDEKTGKLVPGKEVGELTKAIQEYYMSQGKLSTQSRAARSYIKENFNVFISAKDLRKIYEVLN